MAGAGPRWEPGASGAARGADAGQRGARGSREERPRGRAAIPPQGSPRDAILGRPGAAGRAAGGEARNAGAREPPHLRMGGGELGCGLGDGRRDSVSDALPAPLHSAIAAPQRRHRKRPRRSQSAPGC